MASAGDGVESRKDAGKLREGGVAGYGPVTHRCFEALPRLDGRGVWSADTDRADDQCQQGEAQGTCHGVHRRQVGVPTRRIHSRG